VPAVDEPQVELRHGHWPGTHGGLAVDLGVLAGDEVEGRRPQEPAADGEAAEAADLGDGGALERRKGAAGAPEDEGRRLRRRPRSSDEIVRRATSEPCEVSGR
jgi:hypothetical protein